MNDSIRLGSLFGIEIKLHWSMPFLLLVFWLWLAPSFGEYPGSLLPAALVLLGLESIVLLHELGHSLVAKSYGLKVVDITFWPLGGMARMSRIPEDTRIEATIALAGPAVNMALAAIALPIGLLLPEGGLSDLAMIFFWMNLVLGGFNLLPAFPMDGGRVLRAVLAKDGDWLRATENAVRVGRWVALAMVIWSLAFGQFMLIFIAAFVWISGQKELMGMRMRHTGTPFNLAGLDNILRRAAGATGAAGPGSPGGPTGAPFARPVDGYASQGTPQRPHSPAPQRETGQGGGFSEEDIAELEGFHGRLRNFRHVDRDDD